MTASRAVVVLGVLAGLAGLAGCWSDPPAKPAVKHATLRCGDFLSLDDVKLLGLDGSRFNPDETQSDAVLGVRCEVGAPSVTLFFGEQFPLMAQELHGAVSSGQIKAHPGPTIGSETYWTWLGPQHGMLFLASNKRFAGSLSGRDQAQLERLAARLDANMKQR